MYDVAQKHSVANLSVIEDQLARLGSSLVRAKVHRLLREPRGLLPAVRGSWPTGFLSYVPGDRRKATHTGLGTSIDVPVNLSRPVKPLALPVITSGSSQPSAVSLRQATLPPP